MSRESITTNAAREKGQKNKHPSEIEVSMLYGSKKELKKLAKRGLRIKVVSRALSDDSMVYSVQLVDCDEHSVLMLAELDAINEPKARRLAEDIRNSLLHNSIVNVIN